MKQIFEGVKFGDKEKALILEHSDDYNIGIEYEIHFREVIDIPDMANDGFDGLLQGLSDNYDILSDIYMEALYKSDEINFFINNAQTLLNLLYKLSEFQETVKNVLKKDTKTRDMFGHPEDDYEKDVPKFVEKMIEDEKPWIKEFLEKAQVDEVLKDMDSQIMLLDFYFDGSLVEYDEALILMFTKAIEMLTEIIMNDDVTDTQIIDYFEYLMDTKEFYPQLEPEDQSFKIGKDGIELQEIDIDDYLDYRKKMPIDLIEEVVVEKALEYGGNSESYTDDYGIPEMQDLEDANVDINSIDMITQESAEQAEIITHKMNVKEAFKNISEMFRFISDTSETNDFDGMHVSISTNTYDLDDFKLMKFVALLDLPHILDIFPARTHVDDLHEKMQDAVSLYVIDAISGSYQDNDGVLKGNDIVKQLHYDIEREIESEKYQSIKFGDYHFLDGRIELRFFGGEDYHTIENDIKHHILRALYILNFAYTDEHNDVYKKKFVRMVSNAVKKKLGLSIMDLVSFINRMKKLFPMSINRIYNLHGIEASSEHELDDEQMEHIKRFRRYMDKAIGPSWTSNSQWRDLLEQLDD